MTDTEGPRTEAGKRLLAKTTSEYPKGTPRQHWLEIPPEEALDDILAIEAEARADVDRKVDEANAFGYREGHRKARADVDGLVALREVVTALPYFDRLDDKGNRFLMFRVVDVLALLAGDKAEAPLHEEERA